MPDSQKQVFAIKSLRYFANAAYFTCLSCILILLVLGATAKSTFNSAPQSKFLEYGVSIYKFPLVNRYMLATEKDSSLRSQGFNKGRLFSFNDCEVSAFSALSELYDCANVNQSKDINLVVDFKDQPARFKVSKSQQTTPISFNYVYFGIDTLLLSVSLGLSLLLFFKARHYLSGFLLSGSLLLTVCESEFFNIGSSIIGTYVVESIRLNIALIIGPLAMYFFPQAFNKYFWRTPQFAMICLSILAMLMSYHFMSFVVFSYAVSFSLIVIVWHFIAKYHSILNIRERKQVLTMMLCVAIGVVMYLPLVNFGGQYGFLIGRYIIMLSVGAGVFIALMRFGLWQVETLISKSATLSLLSVIAFSVWAGLDQGMQVLLNQTIGLSNKTFTAFLAAAISTAFAVPAYNFISKSCDAFFNKDLHQLKRLLSKDILVLAETQKLSVFVQQLGTRLLKLSGAQALVLDFNDVQRLPEPIHFETESNLKPDDNPIIRRELFDYLIENILSVSLKLKFADRRINREIKHELEEGVDDIARALASCSRWNYLETAEPTTRPMQQT